MITFTLFADVQSYRVYLHLPEVSHIGLVNLPSNSPQVQYVRGKVIENVSAIFVKIEYDQINRWEVFNKCILIISHHKILAMAWYLI